MTFEIGRSKTAAANFLKDSEEYRQEFQVVGTEKNVGV